MQIVGCLFLLNKLIKQINSAMEEQEGRLAYCPGKQRKGVWCMEQELRDQVNQILQKDLDEVYFSIG